MMQHADGNRQAHVDGELVRGEHGIYVNIRAFAVQDSSSLKEAGCQVACDAFVVRTRQDPASHPAASPEPALPSISGQRLLNCAGRLRGILLGAAAVEGCRRLGRDAGAPHLGVGGVHVP